MTREEAIIVLSHIIKSYKTFPKILCKIPHAEEQKNEYVDALKVAIEALSQPIVAKHFDIQSGYIYCSPQIAENVKVVVRCKDCRHRFYDKYNDCYMCDRHEYGESFEDDDFCSWGERREK